MTPGAIMRHSNGRRTAPPAARTATRVRRIGLAVALSAGVAAAGALAPLAPADAAPYPPTNPCVLSWNVTAGRQLVLTGSGLNSNQSADVVTYPQGATVGSYRTDATGAFTSPVSLPAGSVYVVARTAQQVCSTPAPPSTGNGSGNGGSGNGGNGGSGNGGNGNGGSSNGGTSNGAAGNGGTGDTGNGGAANGNGGASNGASGNSGATTGPGVTTPSGPTATPSSPSRSTPSAPRSSAPPRADDLPTPGLDLPVAVVILIAILLLLAGGGAVLFFTRRGTP